MRRLARKFVGVRLLRVMVPQRSAVAQKGAVTSCDNAIGDDAVNRTQPLKPAFQASLCEARFGQRGNTCNRGRFWFFSHLGLSIWLERQNAYDLRIRAVDTLGVE